jgi:hypothetical protein
MNLYEATMENGKPKINFRGVVTKCLFCGEEFTSHAKTQARAIREAERRLEQHAAAVHGHGPSDGVVIGSK